MKEAFERCLFEVCARAGWTLHAYALGVNDYQLAIGLAEANLSEGMRWLKSAFAARCGALRPEGGILFQGRFRSIIVEDAERLSSLCDYIHLKPVLDEAVQLKDLERYRFSSLHWFVAGKSGRPACLEAAACLSARRGFLDTAAGRRKYLAYLSELAQDADQRQAKNFHRMGWGWAYGTKAFKKSFAKKTASEPAAVARKRAKVARANSKAWEAWLQDGLRTLGKTMADAASEPKGADWKVALCAWMRGRALVRNSWLAEKLSMGVEAGVPNYVKQMRQGQRPAAEQALRALEKADRAAARAAKA